MDEHEEHPYHNLFDEFGNYKRRVIAQLSDTLIRPTDNEFENFVDQCIIHAHELYKTPTYDQFYDAHKHAIDLSEESDDDDTPLNVSATPRISTSHEPDYEKLRPLFGWISNDKIKKTFQHTTQLARTTTGTLLKKVYKSQNPALNVIRRGEPVATDKLYSDTPAVDHGSTRCQIFVGMNTDVVDVYRMKASKQFVNTLEDNVRFRGAPSKL